MRRLWLNAVLIVGIGSVLTDPVLAQEVRTLTGYVRSAEDSAALTGVRVHVVGIPGRVLSDDAGQIFFGNLPRYDTRMAFERIGVVPDTVTIPADWSTFTTLRRGTTPSAKARASGVRVATTGAFTSMAATSLLWTRA